MKYGFFWVSVSKMKEQLQALLDAALQTNVREYHTETADVAKEELARL